MKSLNKVTSCKMIKLAPSSVKLMLRLKQEITESQKFFLFIFVYKLFTLLILINKYSYIYSKKELEIQNSIHTLIYVFDFFALNRISEISYSLYNLICLMILFISLLFLLILIFLNFRTEKKYKDIFDRTNNIIKYSIKVFLLLYLFFIIFSHTLIQFLSKVLFDLLSYYFIENSNKSYSIFIVIINILMMIIINILEYKSYFFFNEPFFNSNFPMQMRNSKINIIYFIAISNFVIFHHFVTLIDLNEMFQIPFSIVMILLNTIIFFLLIINLNSFNFQNKINLTIKFFLIFAFVSYIIEEIIKNTIIIIKEIKIYSFLMIIKAIISLIFMYLHKLYLKNYYRKNCCILLFRLFQNNLSIKSIDCLFYFQSLYFEKKSSNAATISIEEEETLILGRGSINNSIDFKNNERFFNKSEDLIDHLLSILIGHIMKCPNRNCNCHIVRKSLFLENKLNLELFFENIYFQIGYAKRPIDIVLLFSDFLVFSKNSDLFAYSILNTYLNKNFSNLQPEKMYHLYMLIIKFVESHHENYKKNYLNESTFNNLFFDITANKKLTNMIGIFNENFRKLLSYSEKFIYDIRFTNIKDSGIIKRSNEVIDICHIFYNIFKRIKKYIILNCIKNSNDIVFELKFKLKLFYKIFSYKIPAKLKGILDFKNNKLDSFEKEKGIILDNKNLIDIGLYDLPILNERFFNKILRNNQVIFEINKIFKIKYFSINLAVRLGYDLDYLLGNDIHIIFPEKLRENHKKVILQHLLVNKNVNFVKKTFAFTSYNKLLPVQLRTSPFPNLSENMMYIANIELLNDENEKNENIYHFILDGEFELISVTQNLEDNFCIYYQLLKKLNVSVLKLFDIQNQSILEKYQNELNEISKEKNKAIFNNIFKTIFNLSIADDTTHSNVKIKIYQDNDDSNNSINDISDVHEKNPTDSKSITENISILNAVKNLEEKKEQKKRIFDKIFEKNAIDEKELDDKRSTVIIGEKNNLDSKKFDKHLLDVVLKTQDVDIQNSILKDDSIKKLNKNETNSIAKFNKIKTKDSTAISKKYKNDYINTPGKVHENIIQQAFLKEEFNNFQKITSKELKIQKNFECLYSNLISLRNKLLEYDPSDINLIKLEKILDNIKKNFNYLKYRKLKITFNLRNFLYTPFYIVSIEEIDTYKELTSTLIKKSNEISEKLVKQNDELESNWSKKLGSSMRIEQLDNSLYNPISSVSTKVFKDSYNKINEEICIIKNSHKNNSKKLKKLEKNNKVEFQEKNHNKINIKNKIINFNYSYMEVNKYKNRNKTFNILLFFLIFSCFISIFVSNKFKEDYSNLGLGSLELLNLLEKQYISIISLHSSIIGILYLYTDLYEFPFDYKLDYYKSKLKLHSKNLKEVKHKFYETLISKKYQDIIDVFHSNHFFTKILLNWEEIQFESNYDTETDNIISQSLSIFSYLKEEKINQSYKYNFDFFISDLKNNLLFDRNYNIAKPDLAILNSKFIEYFFYLNKNIPEGILKKINALNTILQMKFKNIDDQYQILILLIDIINIIIFIITLIFIYVYIGIYNKKIFESIFSILIINKDLDMNLKRLDEEILISRKLIDNFTDFVKIFNLNNYNEFFNSDKNIIASHNQKTYSNSRTNKTYKDLFNKNTESPKITENTINKHKIDIVSLYDEGNINNNQLSVLSREFSPMSKVTNGILIKNEKSKFYLNNDNINISKGTNNITNASGNFFLINNTTNNNFTTTNNNDLNNQIYNPSSNFLMRPNNNINQDVKKIGNNKNNDQKKNQLNNLTSTNITQNNIFETMDYESIKNYFLSYSLKLVIILRYALIIIFFINFLLYSSIIFLNFLSFSDKKAMKDCTNYLTKRYTDLILINNMIRLSLFKNNKNNIDLDPNLYLQNYENLRIQFDLALQNNPTILIETIKIHDTYNKNITNFSEITEINNQFERINFNSKGLDVSADNIINVLKNVLRDFDNYKKSNPNLSEYDKIYSIIKNLIISNNIPILSLQIDYAIEIMAISINKSSSLDVHNINKYYILMLYFDIISITFQGLFYILFLYIAFKKLRYLLKTILFTSKRYKFRLNEKNGFLASNKM